MNNNFKQDILNMLLDIPYAKYDRKSQVTVRCPFCGDSVKNHTHGHFGVKIDLNRDEPIVFHCFRCDISGLFTPNVMRLLGISDLGTSSALTQYNKKAVKRHAHGFTMDNSPVKLKMPEIVLNERTLKKHEYLESRLGVKLDIHEMVNKKVVYSLLNLLKDNEINKLTVPQQQAILLQEEYVGFLSARNEYINFRDITNKNKYRYFIYNVLGRLDNTRKFYIMPNKIDIFTKDNITINIAEGVFDIFGIYHHVFDKHDDNTLYTAVCGAGYHSVIKYLLQMGITCNVDINIFSDSDRPPSFYKQMIKEIDPWINKVNLYYNSKGKDYGVPSDQISLVRKRV